MKHFVCEVTPREFRISIPDQPGTVYTEQAEILRSVDVGGDPKLTNLVHQQAWSALQRLWKK